MSNPYRQHSRPIPPPMPPACCARGFTLLETVVAALIFGLMLSLFSTTLHRANQHRRTIETRRIALFEVASALEFLETEPARWPALNESRPLDIPPELAKRLDAPQFTARALPLADDPSAMRLEVALTWQTQQNRPAAPIALSTIVFRDATPTGETP